MNLSQNKFSSFNSFNINDFTDYDLDYLRSQIRKNSESLERAIENLRKLANQYKTDKNMEKN